VLSQCEFVPDQNLHDDTPFSQFLLQLLPGFVVTNKDTLVQPCQYISQIVKNTSAHIDLLQTQLASLGHHQKKTVQNHPVHIDISLVIY